MRAQSLRDAGADSTNGREWRVPEGEESSPQSRHTTRIVNTRIVRRLKSRHHLKVTLGCESSRNNMLLAAGILLVGFFRHSVCSFFYLTLANGTITLSHYLGPKCIAIFIRRQSGIHRTRDI